MLIVHWEILVDGPPLGEIDEDCPHCQTRQRLLRRALLGRMGFIPIPSGEVLTCPACGKHSRKEGRASRLFAAVFLMPFLLLLAGGVATGVYFLVSMVGAEFSGGFAAAAIALISVSGYLGYRTTLSVRRLLRSGGLLPMDGLMTRL